MKTKMKLCRLCMCQSDLVDKLDDKDFHAKVYECVNIKIDASLEYLPTTVCLPCIKQIRDLHKFRRKCLIVQSLIWSEIQEDLEFLEDEVGNEGFFGVREGKNSEGVINASQTFVSDEWQQIQPLNITSLKGTELKLDEEYLGEANEQPSKNAIAGQDLHSSTMHNAQDVYRSLLRDCTICGKKIEKNRLDGHMNRHKGLLPYECFEQGCTAKFPCKIALRLHCNNQHSAQLYHCNVCSKIFNSAKYLYNHRVAQHSQAIFTCGTCNMAFTTNSQLKRHGTIHEGKKYSCSICSKAFHRNTNLTVHMRTHTKERPYPCNLCNKSFGYARVLKEHVHRIHKNVKHKEY